MFEEALIESSRRKGDSRKATTLPVSIAIHGIVIGIALGASIWFVEDVPEPPIPVTFYAAAPRVFSLSPLEDQLLGALIMWIPGGIIFIIIMTVVFFKWNARGEDSTAGAQVDWKASTA